MITQDQKDSIYNALLIGMTLDDSYIYAGLTPAQIESVSEDEELQALWHSLIKHHEYDLLLKLNTVIEKQKNMGKEGAVTWALEHMYPARYANKQQGDGKTVNIVFGQSKAPVDPAEDTEVVEIHN